MNSKLYKFYGVLCFFPIWVFKSNLIIIELTSLLIVFLILPIFFHMLMLKHHNKTKSNVIYIWLSLVTFYSIDQNLGLWNFSQGFTFINTFTHFLRAAYFSLIVIIFLNLIFFLLKQNAIKISLSFILAIFIFNIIDNSKNYSNFPKVDLSHNKQQITQKTLNKKVVLIFDEMSGLDSLDANVENGDYVNQYILDFFLQNKFNIYSKAFSLFKNTDQSLSSVFNFIKSEQDYFKINKKKKEHFIKKSSNYFIVKNLTDNKFFDIKQNKNIVVQQSMYINFCDHPKVIVCNQFNPFNKNLTFLNGFKNTKLSKYISLYRNNGTIISRVIWRFFLEIRIIDSLLDPIGEKASIKYIFNQLFEDIQNNKDSSLFFSHILVPHIPYGFNKDCNYDGDKAIDYNSMSFDQKSIQHNLEKYCSIKYLEEFFENLKKISEFKNLEIIIFSDHDSRISPALVANNVIFAHKKSSSKKSNLIEETVSINELFYNLNFN
mgnify:CR=1 FL=1